MKAEDLKKALNILNPEHSLRTPEELREFFIERPLSPLKKIGLILRNSDQREKFLFTGHRGSGKTTELNKLRLELEDEFFVIHYSVKNILDLHDLSYVDVILSLALKLVDTLRDKNVQINPKVMQHISNFLRDITLEVGEEAAKGFEVGVEGGLDLKLFIAKLFGRFRTEDKTRTSIREKIFPRVSDLIESIEFLSQEIERIRKQKVLIIVEDLDKTDLETTNKLFYEHATQLLSPPLSIIYTFPIALRFDNNFMQIKSNFPNIEVLPNFKIHRRDGSPDPLGTGQMRAILMRRVEERLFAEDALDILVRNSSGIPRELIALGRTACLESMIAEQPIINREAAEKAVRNRRREYQVLLSQEQINLLKKVKESKWLDNDEKNQPLLHNLSALEYHNDDVWYDVHPLVEPLLAED